MGQLLTLSQSVLQIKVQHLFHSTGHSRGAASARTANFRRWFEAGNKKMQWKSSPQTPRINQAYFEVHSQRGADLHSPGDFRSSCFSVGWVLFLWLYDRAECCAEHNMSLVSVDRKAGGRAEAWRQTWVIPLLPHFWYSSSDMWTIAGKNPKHVLWLQLCKDCVTTELQGLTLSARFKPTNNPTGV